MAAPAAPSFSASTDEGRLSQLMMRNHEIDALRTTAGGGQFFSGRLRSEYAANLDEIARLKVKVDDSAAAKKSAREVGEAVAVAKAKAAVGDESDAAEIARINENRKAQNLPPIASLRQVGPQMTTERGEARDERTVKREESERAWKTASEADRRAWLEKMQGERIAASKSNADAGLAVRERIAAARSAEKSADAQERRAKGVVDEYAKSEDDARIRYETLKDLAAKGRIDSADEDLAKSFDVYESARTAHADALKEYAHPSSVPDVDRAKKDAAEEFKALPPEKQTPEAWAAIKKAKGI